MLNDKTYNLTSLNYKYNCFRMGDEIRFIEFNELNQITTEYLIKIKELQRKEVLKKLTLEELNKVKTIIEEIIQEKQKDMTKCN